jgi:uncharacterized membrane protein YozB (DUF420 family)
MMPVESLPTVNAILNGTSAILLTVGYFLIRQRRINAHRFTMLAALTTSSLFLICYLIYHYNVGTTRFQGPSWAKTLYLIILIPHTILAAVMVPFILVVVFRAFRGQFDKHRRLARWTLPVWLYVSVTGVLVYLMLYQWFPSR